MITPIVFGPSQTLDAAPWGAVVRRILAAGLAAVDPGEAVRRCVDRRGSRLEVSGETIDLSRVRRVRVVGAGKAGAPMAAALLDLIGDRAPTGVVIVKEGHRGEAELPGIALIEAGHPVPDERGVLGARRLASAVAGSDADDLIFALISGGGSALMISPAEGLSLDDLQALTGSLLACGASIDEINTLRKHLETLKGGGLARLAAPARLITLTLSDVIGDPPDVIASGPTAPDRSSFSDAWAILERYNLVETAPAAVRLRLDAGRKGEIADTPKPGDPLFDRVQTVIIGSNRRAALAALQQAKTEGLHPLLLTTRLQGEARHAGRFLAAVLDEAARSGLPAARPACILAGGETTVTLRGGGLGGRNQELALAAVGDLAGLERIALVSLATDGGDGPTDAAGAVVGGETLARARLAGLDPEDHLRRNDSYTFFNRLGDLIRTGPTRTNVNDLAFLFTF